MSLYLVVLGHRDKKGAESHCTLGLTLIPMFLISENQNFHSFIK